MEIKVPHYYTLFTRSACNWQIRQTIFKYFFVILKKKNKMVENADASVRHRHISTRKEGGQTLECIIYYTYMKGVLLFRRH